MNKKRVKISKLVETNPKIQPKFHIIYLVFTCLAHYFLPPSNRQGILREIKINNVKKEAKCELAS